MAPVAVARPTSGFEPPASSILATHVVHGNGVPDFDRDNFNQLLAEALGSDDQGRPNLGADVAVNHKLICIVFQVGIECALEENPFRSAATAGKAEDQLSTCLEVLRVAIERSPQVVFVKSDPLGKDTSENPTSLYCWLVPRLLPLIASSQTEGVREGVLQVFNAMVEADRKCSTSYSCDSVLEFMRACISGEKSF